VAQGFARLDGADGGGGGEYLHDDAVGELHVREAVREGDEHAGNPRLLGEAQGEAPEAHKGEEAEGEDGRREVDGPFGCILAEESG
jgi:hypothetical protein